MKKKTISKILGVISAILVLIFIVKVAVDYHTYMTTLNSAPFYLWIVVDAIYFLLPACVLGIIKLILQRK